MKKNLGNIVLLLLLAQSFLYATQLATYTLHTNKKEAVVKEPIDIIFTAKQTNHLDNMFFLLKPKVNPNYKIVLLEKKIYDKQYHDTTTIFHYILFPLKAKEINISFDFTIQTASDKAVAQSYVDDHDDSIAIQMNNNKIDIEDLIINIKEIPIDIDLVGDFKLSSNCNTKKVSQYDDVSVVYTLEGVGYKNKKNELLKNIPNVTLFSDIHDIYSKLTKNGYDIKRVYTYALSSKENFTIPALKLRAYSLKKHKKYILNTPSYNIEVTKINPQTLLDNTELPFKNSFFKYENIRQLFIYLLIFLAGFLSAKVNNMVLSKKEKQQKFQDIKKSKSPKELILIQINNYETHRLKEFIDELEKLEYKTSKRSFIDLKTDILNHLTK